MDLCSPFLLPFKHLLPSNISTGLEFKKVGSSENWNMWAHWASVFQNCPITLADVSWGVINLWSRKTHLEEWAGRKGLLKWTFLWIIWK